MNSQDSTCIAFATIIKLFIPEELSDAAWKHFSTVSSLFKAFLPQIEANETNVSSKFFVNKEFASQWRIARGLNETTLYAPPINNGTRKNAHGDRWVFVTTGSSKYYS